MYKNGKKKSVGVSDKDIKVWPKQFDKGLYGAYF